MATRSTSFLVAVLLLTALVLLQSPPATASQGCSASELSVCSDALKHPSHPSPQCCARLRHQGPCLCKYARNPAYRRYVSPAQAKKILYSCKIHAPRC